MVKSKIINSKLKNQESLRGCYGTSEWSANSGICCQCKLQNNCGKMKLRHLEN